MSPTERFLYWMRERHNIYLRRQRGEPKPWTEDPILQQYYFTNPYRENDKTTVWFRENVRDPLKNDARVLMATVIFRWFNRISTGEALLDCRLLHYWREDKAVRVLTSLSLPVFTGAYMIKAGNGPAGCKVPNVCRSVTRVWKRRAELVNTCRKDCCLQALWNSLKRFPNLGAFMSYEIVCDLRYTYLLRNADDVDTWSNPGPGAKRGLNRILGRGIHDSATKDWPAQSKRLLGIARSSLLGMPRLEMREIEHSLCEFDKYERARLGQGRMRRRYKGA